MSHESVWTATMARYSDPFFNPYRHSAEVQFPPENDLPVVRAAIPARGYRCGGCGALFGGLSGFDEHRTGDYPERRCRAAEEITARGYVLGPRGWTQPFVGEVPW